MHEAEFLLKSVSLVLLEHQQDVMYGVCDAFRWAKEGRKKRYDVGGKHLSVQRCAEQDLTLKEKTSFIPFVCFLLFVWGFFLCFSLIFIDSFFFLLFPPCSTTMGIVTNSRYTSAVTFCGRGPYLPQMYQISGFQNILHCVNIFLFRSAGRASVMSPSCSHGLPLLSQHAVGCVTCCWVHLTPGCQFGHYALCGFLCRQI